MKITNLSAQLISLNNAKFVLGIPIYLIKLLHSPYDTNNMLDNILISIILYNFATSTLQKGWITRITTHKNEAI